MDYKVLGSDGQLYGPVDLATLKQWVNEGRIVADSVIELQASGQRVPAAAIPELGLSASPPPPSEPAAPTPPPAAQPAPQPEPQPQPAPAPNAAYQRPPADDQPKKKNTTLIIVLIVLLALCVCGCGPLLAAVLFPVFSQAKDAAIKTASLGNLKKLGTATLMYSSDYDDLLPYELGTAEETYFFIEPYANDESILDTSRPGIAYEFNPLLSGLPVSSVPSPATTPLAYESAPTNNKRSLVYLDGAVKTLEEPDFQAQLQQSTQELNQAFGATNEPSL